MQYKTKMLSKAWLEFYFSIYEQNKQTNDTLGALILLDTCIDIVIERKFSIKAFSDHMPSFHSETEHGTLITKRKKIGNIIYEELSLLPYKETKIRVYRRAL